VAMDRHIHTSIAVAKGVSAASAKPEYIAVHYWTRSERIMVGLFCL
jgi:hypothetical protein